MKEGAVRVTSFSVDFYAENSLSFSSALQSLSDKSSRFKGLRVASVTIMYTTPPHAREIRLSSSSFSIPRSQVDLTKEPESVVPVEDKALG